MILEGNVLDIINAYYENPAKIEVSELNYEIKSGEILRSVLLYTKSEYSKVVEVMETGEFQYNNKLISLNRQLADNEYIITNL